MIGAADPAGTGPLPGPRAPAPAPKTVMIGRSITHDAPEMTYERQLFPETPFPRAASLVQETHRERTRLPLRGACCTFSAGVNRTKPGDPASTGPTRAPCGDTGSIGEDAVSRSGTDAVSDHASDAWDRIVPVPPRGSLGAEVRSRSPGLDPGTGTREPDMRRPPMKGGENEM